MTEQALTCSLFTHALKGEDRNLHRELPGGRHLLVVADGHGGADVAERAVTTIRIFFEKVDVVSALDGEASWDEAAVRLLADAVEAADRVTRDEFSGAVLTAVLVAPEPDGASDNAVGETPSVRPLRFAWAQVGDTAAVWRDADGGVSRTPDHNCRSNLAEREAAEARGGRYIRGYIMAPNGSGGLQPARSLGDTYMGKVTSKEPELGSGCAHGPLVVTSDGIVNGIQDSAEAEHAVFTELIERIEAGEDLDRAVSGTCPGGFKDDVTVFAVV